MNPKDLPQYTIAAIRSVDDQSVHLEGTFSSLVGVNREGWDYLYRYGVRSWLPAEVVSLNEEARTVVYSVYTQHATPFHLKTGDQLAWINSYWRPEYVEAVLDPEKKWQKRAGAADVKDKCARCFVCDVSIEAQNIYWWSEPYGSTQAFFACDRCYQTHVVPRDLSFMF